MRSSPIRGKGTASDHIIHLIVLPTRTLFKMKGLCAFAVLAMMVAQASAYPTYW